MAGPTKNLFGKVFWYVLLLSTLCGFSFHLSTLVTRFLSTPTSTQIDREEQIFPEIMICNNFPFAQTPMQTFLSDEIISLTNHLAAQILQQGLISGLDPTENDNTDADTDVLADIIMSSIPQMQIGYNFANRRSAFILDCEYNDGMNCNFDDFKEIIHREYIKCFIFKAPIKTKLKSLKLTLFADMVNPSTLPSKYDFMGISFLHLYPNGKIKWDITPGANVFIYPKGVYPHHKHRTRISMGMEHHIEVKQETAVLENTKNRPCLQADSKLTTFSIATNVENTASWKDYKYTTEDCEYNSVVNHFAKQCGCIPIGYLPTPSTVNYTYCGNITVAKPEKFQIKWKCYQRELRKKHEISTKHCQQTCKNTFYARFLSSTNWPLEDVLYKVIQKVITRYYHKVNETVKLERRALQHYINTSFKIQELWKTDASKITIEDLLSELELGSSFRDNFLKVRIFTRQMNAAVTKEYKAYPIQNLLSDFGGIVGLYLGISVLTFADLFKLISTYITSILGPEKKKKHNQVNNAKTTF